MRPDKILRFTLIERLIHWSQALPFLGLLLTGLAMHWPSFGNLVFGSLETTRAIHKITALCWLIIPSSLIFKSGRSCMMANLRDIFRWHKADFIWLWSSIKKIFKKGTALPPQGRFNAGQKINFLLTLVLVFVFSISGLFIWITQGRGWFLPIFIHNIAFILVWPTFFGHIFFALLNPTTRESIKGMIWGKVDSQWAREHHLLWYRDLTDEAYPGLVFCGKEGLGLSEMARFVEREGVYPGKDRREIRRLLKYSKFIIAVRNNGTIIGLGRAVSDGISYGIITDTHVKQGFTSPDLAEKIVELLTVQMKPLGVPITYVTPKNDHQPSGHSTLT